MLRPSLHLKITDACNFRCRHCIQDASMSRRVRWTDQDYHRIEVALAHTKFKTVTLTGGEPTLDIETMEKLGSIIKMSPSSSALVGIATNAWFAKDQASLEATLNRLSFVEHLFLSIDKYHLEFLHLDDYKRLIHFCRDNHVGFSFKTIMDDPMDLCLIETWENELECKIPMEKVVSVGRAQSSISAFPPGELARAPDSEFERCPILGATMYSPDIGFSCCCGDLFHKPKSQELFASIIHNGDYVAFQEIPFVQFLQSESFLQRDVLTRLRKNNLQFQFSAVCTYCEHVWINEYHRSVSAES